MSEGFELAIQLLHSCLLPICSHHAWVNFEGAAEIYNELMRTTNNENTKELSQYLESHPVLVTLHETASGMLATFLVLVCTLL